VGGSLDAMLQSYGRLPIPTREEQVLLGRAIRAWLDWEPSREERAAGVTKPPWKLQRAGERARDQLVSRNMLLVAKEARSFSVKSTPALDVEDLIQEGAIGLCRAAEKFDPALGYTFSTYASLWIRQSMTRLIHSSGAIRIPTKRSQSMHRLRQWAEAFAVRTGRPPTAAESIEAGIAGVRTVGDLVILREAAAAYQVVSLDAARDEDSDPLLNFVVAPVGHQATSVDGSEWEVVVAVLRPWPLLQEVMERRLTGQDYKEISVAMGITVRTAVRQEELAILMARDLLDNARRTEKPQAKTEAEAPTPPGECWQPSLFPTPP